MPSVEVSNTSWEVCIRAVINCFSCIFVLLDLIDLMSAGTEDQSPSGFESRGFRVLGLETSKVMSNLHTLVTDQLLITDEVFIYSE